MSFTEQEIAFIYLLDSMGIEYYMRTNACNGMEVGEMLFFKDRVYREIFGIWPRLIKVFPDKTIRYDEYYEGISASVRANYYTDAEVIFGEHPIYDLISFISFLADVVPSVSLSLFSIFYPPAGAVIGAIELVKFLYFSASVTGVLSSGVNSTMEAYTEDVYSMAYGKDIGEEAGRAMGWVNFVFSTFSTILDASKVFVPPVYDITTYHRANSSKYCVKYNSYGSELYIRDIISRISE